MVSLMALGMANHGYEPYSIQTNVYEIGICCFPTKHTALRSKIRDWFIRNQYDVSKQSHLPTYQQTFVTVS